MEQIRLRIEGMSCSACANRVARALREVEGVSDAQVNLADAAATVACEAGTDPGAMVAAVEAKGYRARVES